VNHGILAKQFGHSEEAEQNWRKALALDPSQTIADLYLAAALDQEGKVDAAIAHYQAFLTKIAQQPLSERPPAASLIAVVLKLADCDSRANHPDQALQFYKMAGSLAAQSHEAKLQSFAIVAQASLEAKLGQTRDALRLYQQALELDAGLDDRHTEAVDWYIFAMFLRGAHFPARLAYASLLESQKLSASDSNDARSAAGTSQVDKELEKELGSEATVIRRNPEPLLREALQLTPLEPGH